MSQNVVSHVYYFVMFVVDRLQEDHPIMSFILNNTGRLALVNIATQVTQYLFVFCSSVAKSVEQKCWEIDDDKLLSKMTV